MLYVRDFPPDLQKRLKGLALKGDETLREVIIRAAEREAERLEAEDKQ